MRASALGYSGVRLGTDARVKVQDFYLEAEHEATVRINEKGEKRRTIGIHFVVAESATALPKGGHSY
jgi:lysylphosphatidylglycerol synthetase-like protein (DUF2156 family)